MQPVNANNLVKYGESFNRLGNLKRAESYSKTKDLEDLIIKTSHLPCSADIFPCQPPYFNEFTYTDMLGGMLLRTFSAEINARIATKLTYFTPPEILVDTFMNGIKDKYQMKGEYTKQHDTVVFLCGHNIFDMVVNTDKLYEIMDTNKEAIIKPHPLTSDDLLRNLGANFGYQRILDKNISGMEVLANCNTAVTLTTSEMSIVATLLGKNNIDITNYLQSWKGISYVFHQGTKDITDKEEKKRKLLAMLLNKSSGFVLPSMEQDEQVIRINSYCSIAMQERKQFEMLTPQRLMLVTQKLAAPRPPAEQKKEIRK